MFGSMSWKASLSPVTMMASRSIARGALGQRAQDVVGFVAVGGDGRNAERGDQLHDALDLRRELVGHFGARGFVIGELVIAERAPFIEGHGDVIGLFVVPHFQQHRGKAIDGIRELALARGEARAAALIVQRQTIEGAIGE